VDLFCIEGRSLLGEAELLGCLLMGGAEPGECFSLISGGRDAGDALSEIRPELGGDEEERG